MPAKPRILHLIPTVPSVDTIAALEQLLAEARAGRLDLAVPRRRVLGRRRRRGLAAAGLRARHRGRARR